MKKTYHIAMVEDKHFGIGTLMKVGAVAAAAFVAYAQLSKKDDAKTTDVEVSKFSVDKAAKDAGDFAAKVLKAAKKLPDALK